MTPLGISTATLLTVVLITLSATAVLLAFFYSLAADAMSRAHRQRQNLLNAQAKTKAKLITEGQK